jgi:aminotransferase
MPRVRWTPTAGGLFAFARIAECRDSTRLAHDLLEQAHVVTIPGVAFGTSGEGCLRISYGYASQHDLADALQRIARFLAGETTSDKPGNRTSTVRPERSA